MNSYPHPHSYQSYPISNCAIGIVKYENGKQTNTILRPFQKYTRDNIDEQNSIHAPTHAHQICRIGTEGVTQSFGLANCSHEHTHTHTIESIGVPTIFLFSLTCLLWRRKVFHRFLYLVVLSLSVFFLHVFRYSKVVYRANICSGEEPPHMYAVQIGRKQIIVDK